MELIPLRLSVTNCYLAKTGAQYVLIDTGYEEDWDLFCRRLKEAGVTLVEIGHIILTHHHDDHCGLLNRITQENPAVRIVMSILAPDLLLAGKNDSTHGGGLINRRVARVLAFKQVYLSLVLRKTIDRNKNLTFAPYHAREQDILVNAPTRLQNIGIELDGALIATPGHSTDSISVLFDDGDAVVGDAAANFLQFAGTKYCVIYVQDLEEYYRSWEAIMGANAKRIFPAHGKPFPVARLKENIWKNRKQDMVTS